LKEKHRLQMFQKKAWRKISGPRKEQITWGWRKLRNDRYCSRNTIRLIKSRRMRWAWHVG